MSKIYQVICCLMILLLLAVGTVSLLDRDADFSETEGRYLKRFPKITVTSLLDGEFLRELEQYYEDTFPFRETLLGSQSALEALYGLDSPAGESE